MEVTVFVEIFPVYPQDIINYYRKCERYYRLVTQFELMGGSFDRARAGFTDAIGYLRGRPEKHAQNEIPALPAAKSLGNGNGVENGIAKIAAAIEGERPRAERENS